MFINIWFGENYLMVIMKHTLTQMIHEHINFKVECSKLKIKKGNENVAN